MSDPRTTTSRQPQAPSRRHFLQRASVASAGAALLSRVSLVSPAESTPAPPAAPAPFQHSICFWCFEKLGLEALAVEAKNMGVRSIELVPPQQWPILQKHGLVCAMTPSHPFLEGWAHLENHANCAARVNQAIDATAAAGFPNVITFSGLRKGMSDEQGLKNTVAGLKTVIAHAEKKKVNVCIEVLNSRIDTWMIGVPDYMCDRVEWAIEVCKQVGSERMKLLFDIFHVQVMQGDLIARIRQNHPFIAHYHTAGVPGRHEIDQTQEINYPAVMRAIAETGFTGFVGQEFLPTRDPLQSLKEAVALCQPAGVR